MNEIDLVLKNMPKNPMDNILGIILIFGFILIIICVLNIVICIVTLENSIKNKNIKRKKITIVLIFIQIINFFLILMNEPLKIPLIIPLIINVLICIYSIINYVKNKKENEKNKGGKNENSRRN